MTMREKFVQAVKEAQKRLDRYDLAQTPLPHADDCPCMLGDCTLRRLGKLPKIEWEPGEHEAFMDAMGYGPERTEEVAP